MILRVHHIGLVVEDLDKAVRNYEKLFGTKATDFRNDQGKKNGVSHQLDARIMMPNHCWLHLVQNWNPDSRVNKFLQQHGEALEHVALETTDIEEEMCHLREIGCPVVGDYKINNAADGFESFITPEDGIGFTVELIQPHHPKDEDFGDRGSIAHFGLGVRDIDSVVADLRAKGVQFMTEEIEDKDEPLGGLRAIQLLGPADEHINLYEWKREI